MARMTPPADMPARPVRRHVDLRTRVAENWPAALAGAIAAGVAMAAAELFAGLVHGAPSLVIEIGGLLISLQPPGAKDLFVSLFGTNDKLALNILIVIVALVVAAAAGVLARRNIWLGGAIVVVFGVVGLIAGLRDPLITPALAVLNATLAIVVGIVALVTLVRMGPQIVRGVAAARGQTQPGKTSPGAIAAMPDWDRRRFLIASAGALAAAAVVGRFGRGLLDGQHPSGIVSTNRLPAALNPVPALTADEMFSTPGLTPLVMPNKNFYRIDTALLVPNVDVDTWKLEVKGMVDRPLTFTFDQLVGMPLFEQYVTIACVSNHVGENLVGNALWTGVRLKDILDMAGVQTGATQIVGRSVDDFTVGFPTMWATDPDREPMIAVGMNRDLLPSEHGYPARLIVPGLYGYVSATKWLSSIELTTREAVDGYWVPLGWAKDAPILTQSRIDVPQSGASLPAGPVTIGGVAWAPDRGITKVEYNIDGGAWQTAQISKPISNATWVQWVATWTATSGRHGISVRATDGTGDVQTAQLSDPAPDGARGHHTIAVVVS